MNAFAKVSLLGLALASSAWSATIHTSFGLGDSYDTAAGVTIGEPLMTQVAVPFMPLYDANLLSLRLAIEDFASVPNEFIVSVAASAGGLPGAALETFNIAFPFPQAIVTLTSVTQPLLVSGSKYWVVVAAVDPTMTEGKWHYNDQALVGYVYQDTKSFGWASFDGPTPAVEVNVTPEPWSGALAGLGLVLLIARRKISRA